MRTALEFQEKLRLLYAAGPKAGRAVPRYLQVKQWVVFANDYLAASKKLHSSPLLLMHPWMQVSGHAIECSIKAYLCALGTTIPRGHDLVRLIDLAVSAGLEASEQSLGTVVHVNHLYSNDLRSVTKYKARYPAERIEYSGGSIPALASVEQIVNSNIEQACRLNEAVNSL